MSRPVRWTTGALKDYEYWKRHDKKIVGRIDALVESAAEDHQFGIGKPERLKYYEPKPAWSRRITDEHRLVYAVKGDELWILQCRFHNDD